MAIGLIASGAIAWKTGIASASFGGSKDEMAKNLAAKLDIDQNKVENALGDIQTERQAEMKQKMKDSRAEELTKAVADGVLTEDQKNQLLEKQSQHQAEQSALRDKHRAEMEQWLKDNNIDSTKLDDYMTKGSGGQGRGMGHKGMN